MTEAVESPRFETMSGRMPSDVFHPVSETIIHTGAVIDFRQVVIGDSDGKRFARDVIRHPGAVSIIPFDGTNVTLVRQYRAAIDGDLFEIPAGKRDVRSEPPEITARRELAEEVGLEAAEVEFLVNMHHSPGFCDEYGFIFVARGLSPVPVDREGPEEQAMTLHTVPLDDAVTMCLDGRITDSKSMIGLMALSIHEGRS
ncbi:MAG: NUDIX hydrolase [Acidimicrobiia bacterium]|nr:NUDIX hydrolase [Acidimicrobiia bacterium]